MQEVDRRQHVSMECRLEQWPLVAPFRITGHVWEAIEVLVVSLEQGGCIGRGEAAGVYYRNETAGSMRKQIESLRGSISRGLTREALQTLLPPGGARNALDCALWDLQAKLTGMPVWQRAGLKRLRPLLTTFTCGADTPQAMAATARGYKDARAIKIKLTGEPVDAHRVCAIRDACPGAWLGVDGNQGFTREALEGLLPVLIDAHVELIEQPFPIGFEAWLSDVCSPIPVAADESAQKLADLPSLVGRFRVVNIKLDKCGGLTEALAITQKARELGLDCMVGNMMGTSLAMAPAYIVGQLCRVVDLDGPVFLKSDRASKVCYAGGNIECPSEVWGA